MNGTAFALRSINPNLAIELSGLFFNNNNPFLLLKFENPAAFDSLQIAFTVKCGLLD